MRAAGDYAGDLSAGDRQQLISLEPGHPRAVASWRAGEEALRAGDLARAERLFAESRAELPGLGLAARRHCQVLTELGRRGEALDACRAAVANGATGRDLRATVGALMSGRASPTTEDFANASVFANGVIRETIQGNAARFDIGQRLEDRTMMKQSLENLERLAPDHFETRRARAALPRPWRSWLWLALGAFATLGTLAHALRRRARLVRPVVAATLVLWVAAPAHAAPGAVSVPGGATSFPVSADTFRIDDADPSANIPSEEIRNRRPLEFGYFLQELLERGERAMKAGQPQVAKRYYQAVAKAVPNMATGFSKLCATYEVMGDRTNGRVACREAMNREGARLEDHVRFVRMVTAQEVLPAKDLEELDAVFVHLDQADDVSRLTGNQMNCDLALRLSDRARLERCTAALVQLAPTNARTVTFQWALAMQKGDRAAARRLVQAGRQAGIDEAGIARMEAATTAAGAQWGAALRGLGIGVAMVLAGAVVMLSRKRTARA